MTSSSENLQSRRPSSSHSPSATASDALPPLSACERSRITALRAALVGAALLSAVAASQAQGHFQLLYTPQIQQDTPGDVPLKLVFWHPFDNGPVMEMGQPEAFTVTHRGKTTDLSGSLKPVQFSPATAADQNGDHAGPAQAFDAVLPVRRSGDYVLALTPAPYYEASEDKFIQQITKSYINSREIPTDWTENLGLKAEIRPLTRPTNILAGSSFTGQVLSEGKPVEGAMIEVEYMAAPPLMDENRPGPASTAPAPGGTLEVISGPDGLFTLALPRAGFWGFAALEVGPDKEHEGKPLSQDAVIWVYVQDLPPAPAEGEAYAPATGGQ